MFSLRSRQDGFRLKIPDEFIIDEINEKYTNIIKKQKSYLYKPIDFLNETIQSVQILGILDASVEQQQSGNGKSIYNNPATKEANRFQHTATDYNYRSEKNPLALVDKTLNVYFRHTLGYVNYFLIFENFFWQYARDTKYDKLCDQFVLDIYNNIGEVYSRIIIMDPVISEIDMLDFNYNQPVAQSQNFKVVFKYSNLDYQFIDIDKKEDD